MIKTLGGFYCPHCYELNLCDCKSCKEFYEKNGMGNMKFCTWTDDKNEFICSYCNELFSPDASLDAEYKIIKLQ